MNSEIVKHETRLSVFEAYSPEQVSLLKTQIAPKATDDELALFLTVCKQRNLDPFGRQIYAIHRGQWDRDTRQMVDKMTIQVSIDGFRSLADRTGTYAPGDEAIEMDGDYPVSATVSVRKLVAGKWIKFASTAYWSEYAQWVGKEHEKKLSPMWFKMPRTMLLKCAEAKALRKGWPDQLGELYTSEEMDQAIEEPRRVIPDEQPRRVAFEAQTYQLTTATGDVVEVKKSEPAPEPKPSKKSLPPPPDKVTEIPLIVCNKIESLRQYIGLPIAEMTLEEAEHVVAECRKYAERVTTEDGRKLLAVVIAAANARIDTFSPVPG